MLRIIAGKFKGRQLQVPEDGTKPLTDRIKTSLFDLIHDFLTADARILDLFSGSGNFAFEALSRGVAHVVMVDNGEAQYLTIQKNISILGCKQLTELRKQDAFAYLRTEDRTFDIIMLDPPFPFSLEKKNELLKLSLKRLTPEGILIFRYPNNEEYSIDETTGFQEVLRQKYGLSVVSFCRKM